MVERNANPNPVKQVLSAKELKSCFACSVRNMQVYSQLGGAGRTHDATMRLASDETILDDTLTYTIIFDNDDFDESQDQEKEKVLPIPSELKVIRYNTYNKNNNQVEGFLFIFPSQNSAFYAETEELNKDQAEEFKKFSESLTKFLVATVERVNPSYKSKRDLVKYIQPSTDIDEVLRCNDLTEMFATNFSRSYASSDSQSHESKFKDIDYKRNLVEERGNFCKYEPESNSVITLHVNAKFSIDEAKNFETYVSVFQDDGLLVHRCLIEEQRGFGCLVDLRQIMWIDEGLDREGPQAWGFCFLNKDTTKYSFEMLTKLTMERQTEKEYDKIVEEDPVWARKASAFRYQEEDVDMEELKREIDSEEEDFQSAKDDASQQSTGNKSQEYADEAYEENMQAFSYNRDFMLRGPVVQVYARDEENFKPKFQMTFKPHLDRTGDVIKPANLMLQSGETSLLYANGATMKDLYQQDLNTGQIVEEFNAGGKELVHFTNPTKNGQVTDDQTILALANNSILLLDRRVNGKNKIAREKSYKSAINFVTAGVTVNGGFATGSMNGEIRLYKEVGQIAKTLLPGLGEPIIALDASLDSKWLLATCQTYILVVKTSFDEDKLGYTHRMGQDKPTPIKLTLKPQDRQKYKLRVLNFRPARFNNGSQNEEVAIVSSSGDCLITWNFKLVQRGHFSAYKVTQIGEQIVDNQFMYDDPSAVLVTTMSQLNIKKKK